MNDIVWNIWDIGMALLNHGLWLTSSIWQHLIQGYPHTGPRNAPERLSIPFQLENHLGPNAPNDRCVSGWWDTRTNATVLAGWRGTWRQMNQVSNRVALAILSCWQKYSNMGYTGARITISWGHVLIQHWILASHFQSHVLSNRAPASTPYQPCPVDTLAQSLPKWMVFRLVKCGKLPMMPCLSSFWQPKNFHIQLQTSALGSTVAHLPCTFRWWLWGQVALPRCCQCKNSLKQTCLAWLGW